MRTMKLFLYFIYFLLMASFLVKSNLLAQNEIQWIVDPEKYDVVEYSEYGYHVVQKNKKWGYVDNSGKIVIPIHFDDAYPFSTVGFAPVKINGKWGFIDKKGDFTTVPTFDECSGTFRNTSDGSVVIYVVKNKQGIYVNEKGENLFPNFNNYKYLNYEQKGFASFKKKESQDIDTCNNGIVKFPNKVIVPPKFQWVRIEHGMVSAAVDDYNYSIYGLNGEVIVPLDKQYLFIINENLIAKLKDGDRNSPKYALLNGKGKQVTKYIYDNVDSSFQDGLLVVQKDNKFGAIDFELKEIVPFQFEKLEPFHNGSSVAAQKGKFGLIDKQGKWLINPQYDSLDNFKNEYGIARLKNKSFLIDKTGKIITKKYFRIENYMNMGFSLADNEGKKILLDSNGKEISAPLYDFAHGFQVAKLIFLSKNNKLGAVDKTGKEVLPYIFDVPICYGEIDYVCDLPIENGNTVYIKYKGKFGILKWTHYKY